MTRRPRFYEVAAWVLLVGTAFVLGWAVGRLDRIGDRIEDMGVREEVVLRANVDAILHANRAQAAAAAGEEAVEEAQEVLEEAQAMVRTLMRQGKKASDR